MDTSHTPLALAILLIVSVSISGCCLLPNGGIGDRRKAFAGDLVKGTAPGVKDIAGRYELVAYRLSDDPHVFPRIDVVLKEDGTFEATGDLEAVDAFDGKGFKGPHTPDRTSTGTWEIAEQDEDHAAVVRMALCKTWQSWYLLKIDGDSCFATWFGDPDMYQPIQFRCTEARNKPEREPSQGP